MTTAELKTGVPQLWRVVSEIVDASVSAHYLGKTQAEAVTALKADIRDAFDAGQFGVGIEKLLAAVPRKRAQRAVTDLLDSALLSLGVDTTVAAANWQQVIQKLEKAPSADAETPNLRASPIRDAFRGISIRFDADVRQTLRRTSLELARLDAALKKALGAEQPITALRGLENKLDLATMPDATLMGFVSGYRRLESWADLIRVYEKAPDEFRRMPAARREYALALLQSGHADQAHQTLRQAVNDGDKTSSTLGLFGRVMKDRYDAAVAAKDPEEAHRYLSGAIYAYRTAMRREPTELYPGVALPVLLELRGSHGDAVRNAELVLTNAVRRASFGENHYWDAAAALEMSLFLERPADAKKWLKTALNAESERWMRKSTFTNLERLSSTFKAEGRSTTEIDAAISALKASEGIPGEPSPENKRSALLDSILGSTYRAGGRSPKWLSGNYSYEGIAHDVRVTPSDMTYFERILKSAGISKIRDPLAASAAMDKLIREHFSTAEMEDKKSPRHLRYDKIMPGLAKLMAATASNSQTNVSADWINRLADCRQHAPAKLLLWEAWKTGRASQLLRQIDGARLSGDDGKAAKASSELRSLNAWELRVLDAEIVDAKTSQPLEEHTMTVLVRRQEAPPGGSMTELAELRLADSFYQNVFAFGGGAVTPELRDGKLWIPVPTPLKDGRTVALRPAHYSFDRAAPSVDFGQLEFRGLQVGSPGWEHDLPVEGIDLKYLHDYAARPSVLNGPL